jgi:flavin-binding protein dodecin
MTVGLLEALRFTILPTMTGVSTRFSPRCCPGHGRIVWEDAAKNALEEAKKTLRNIRSIYVKELEAKVENDQIVEFEINAKISFDLESDRMEKSSK